MDIKQSKIGRTVNYNGIRGVITAMSDYCFLTAAGSVLVNGKRIPLILTTDRGTNPIVEIELENGKVVWANGY